MRKINDVDLKLLHLFITIVDSGGFSAAQFKLNMHQSTISTKMNDLETRLGMTLCYRGRRGFRLTSDGNKVYQLSQTLFDDISHFENQLDNIRDVSHGHIRLALTDNLATNPQCKIQQGIRHFCNNYPKVTIDTDIWNSYQIEMMLLEGKVELGITSSEVQKDGLNYRYLFEEKQCLYCAPEHPILAISGEITTKDILKFPIVDRGLSHKITPFSDTKNLMHLASSTNMEATAHLILSGTFVGYLPDHYASIWEQRGEMVKVNATSLEYLAAFHLTTLDSKELSLAATELMHAISNVHINKSTSMTASI
ncbi:MAG: LysR family transcriptional regulator [Photobacterium frigidiphilum]|uniref:LysR family transcriptional regulator n=1 Tax=Photobacterium frigidiphilum TaxID=264736 RepID=A0A2T3JND9_9GAMM|nr:LysR family transcriptional regulator [Photobacterium frigidiphilum]PSU50552.1 LysR family transcriptional regulator [Photobacterium frigidiphilum]